VCFFLDRVQAPEPSGYSARANTHTTRPLDPPTPSPLASIRGRWCGRMRAAGVAPRDLPSPQRPEKERRNRNRLSPQSHENSAPTTRDLVRPMPRVRPRGAFIATSSGARVAGPVCTRVSRNCGYARRGVWRPHSWSHPRPRPWLLPRPQRFFGSCNSSATTGCVPSPPPPAISRSISEFTPTDMSRRWVTTNAPSLQRSRRSLRARGHPIVPGRPVDPGDALLATFGDVRLSFFTSVWY
jgi:hypothetical protein